MPEQQVNYDSSLTCDLIKQNFGFPLMTPSKLLQPITAGELTLQHRVVGAPLTRFRGSPTHVPDPVMSDYLRASFTRFRDATNRHWRMVHITGIWNQEHINAWKLITDRVHAKDCYIFCQLWAHGRAAYPEVLAAEDPSFPYIAPSDIPLAGQMAIPRPKTVEEIEEYDQLYTEAARNTIKAGFDSVEIQGANGHLLDQFTQDVSHRRSDQYGGSIMNRVRFPLQVIDAVMDAVGAEKLGIASAPGIHSKDPKPTFTCLVSPIKEKSPDFAYIHVGPRIVDMSNRSLKDIGAQEEDGFLREISAPKPVISAGGYDQSRTITAADEKNNFIAFGRHFFANETFNYIGGHVAKGYTDYPIAAYVHWAKAAL
ncbi:hypothetical protein EV421DRAFT_1743067 [Armillaria borealis]|uniref:NADH:flavin oxidoreductase/NADH oxidase N-terminal domain-containing protein n=1 Tax=Armillaria borealis TaxID=47425 RepID=A0AA39ME58_9AGAR|nr:hypothetical protein EV421DRAFT_1743067 [Armillaria borealis]